MNIYDVSNNKVQDSIKSYIVSLNLKTLELADLLEFKLLLLTRDFITFNDFNFEDKINKFIEPYIDGKSFSSFLYQINNLFEYLIDNKQIKNLENIQEKVLKIIKQYESRKLW